MPIHLSPAGTPCWFELVSPDPERSISFHRELFGWQAVPGPAGGGGGAYWFLRNGNGTLGALRGLAPGEPRGYWNVYFGVADVDASLARAEAAGAKRLFDPFDAPGFGRGEMLTDPVGAVTSLWQAANPGDAGDFVMFEDHAIGWVELAACDGDSARDFYCALLGWDVSESTASGFRYLYFAVEGTRYGGIMPMTKEWGDMPSHWSVYVPVPDVDACCARAMVLGGTVCVPAFEAPGVGRIARIDDPAGVGCYVIRRTSTTG
jgi:predicted enzyme related to lactoylglutathione lyase